MTVFGLSSRLTRTAVIVLIALDLAALASFSLRRVTTTTSTLRSAGQGSSTITSAQPPATTPVIPEPVGTGVVPVSNPISSTGTTTHTPAPPKTTHPKTPPPAAPPPAAPPTTGTPPVTKAAIGDCPVKLAKPNQMGGLQSFVPFAPAFGPFSAEAFAAAAAYQPELELLGPILAEYPQFGTKLAPALDPLLKLFGTGSNALFSLVSPIYTPYRTKVLAAETKLAAAFAPYSKKLAGQPLAGCAVDLEAALVGDTRFGKSPALIRLSP